MVEKKDNTGTTVAAFQQAADRKRSSLIWEFGRFIMHNKKWWLVPIIIILLLAAMLVLLSGTAVAPFIYTLY